jgi:hypothetical protein
MTHRDAPASTDLFPIAIGASAESVGLGAMAIYLRAGPTAVLAIGKPLHEGCADVGRLRV